MRTHDKIHPRAAHVVVHLAARHVVTHVVETKVLEDCCAAQTSKPRRGQPVARGDVRQTVHIRVQRIPHKSVQRHSRQPEGKSRLERPAKKEKHREYRWDALQAHVTCYTPGEGSAAVLVAYHALRWGRGHPHRIVLRVGG